MALPEPTYRYQPVYGVDPYQDNGPHSNSITGAPVAPNGEFGGGAEITGQNLLVSLWWVENEVDVDGIPIPEYGGLLIPYPEFGNIDRLAAATNIDVVPGRNQEFLSRTAARFLLNIENLSGAWYLLAVLNPPAGLKNRLAGATNYKMSNGNLVGSTKKPLLDSMLWNAEGVSSSGASYGAESVNYRVGQADTYAGGGYTLKDTLPLLKTSGADGVYPVFFGGTPNEILAEQAARDAGNFYVPVRLDVQGISQGDNAIITISYPHSAARGH